MKGKEKIKISRGNCGKQLVPSFDRKMIASILFNAVVIVVAVIGNFLITLVAALNRLFHNMRSFLLESLALSHFFSATVL